jgi:hypothetical protein
MVGHFVFTEKARFHLSPNIRTRSAEYPLTLQENPLYSPESVINAQRLGNELLDNCSLKKLGGGGAGFLASLVVMHCL